MIYGRLRRVQMCFFFNCHAHVIYGSRCMYVAAARRLGSMSVR